MELREEGMQLIKRAGLRRESVQSNSREQLQAQLTARFQKRQSYSTTAGNMITMKFTIVAACVAFALAAPTPQLEQGPGFSDVVNFVGEGDAQLDPVDTGVSTGPESDPTAVGFEEDPDYYNDSEPEAADVGGFADYTESDSNIGHRVVRSPARPRSSGRFGPVRRRQFKLGGFRKLNTRH
ncbi:hypothetical protein FHG87_011299 [Trinorchestia longiramus]|nr:hypothetical protein FHG87_011299 [Trinorchestia longiramus]